MNVIRNTIFSFLSLSKQHLTLLLSWVLFAFATEKLKSLIISQPFIGPFVYFFIKYFLLLTFIYFIIGLFYKELESQTSLIRAYRDKFIYFTREMLKGSLVLVFSALLIVPLFYTLPRLSTFPFWSFSNKKTKDFFDNIVSAWNETRSYTWKYYLSLWSLLVFQGLLRSKVFDQLPHNNLALLFMTFWDYFLGFFILVFIKEYRIKQSLVPA